eukprot:jgi/Chlat1/7587/Chrsp63S09150
MEYDDEEFEQLLEEIPRATSAPPHLEELQKAYNADLARGHGALGGDHHFYAAHLGVGFGAHHVAGSHHVRPFEDIRLDEDYDSFYRAYSGNHKKELPAPIDQSHYLDIMGRHASSSMDDLDEHFAQLYYQERGYLNHRRDNDSLHSSQQLNHNHDPPYHPEHRRRHSAGFHEQELRHALNQLQLERQLPPQAPRAHNHMMRQGYHGGGGSSNGHGSLNRMYPQHPMRGHAGKGIPRSYSSPAYNVDQLDLDNGGSYGQNNAHPHARPHYQQPAHQPPHSVYGSASQSYDSVWGPGSSSSQRGAPPRSPPQHAGGSCRYFSQGYCSRGEACPYPHVSPSPMNARLRRENNGGGQHHHALHAHNLAPPLPMQQPLQNHNSAQSLSPPSEKSSGSRRGRHRKKEATRDAFDSNGDSRADRQVLHGMSYCLLLKDLKDVTVMLACPWAILATQNRYNSLDEVVGRIYQIAKDQHGCRFLQKKFDEGGPQEVAVIFAEIIDHIAELMVDPFGNYLAQKLLEVCNEDQRYAVLRRVTSGHQLVHISVDMHGTRAVQKLIETLKEPDQVSMVVRALSAGVVTLVKDLNGNHVVQRCLQRLSAEDNQFIFDAAVNNCVEVSTHRHGCCVLQRCVDYASGAQQHRLVGEIAAHALVLSQDPFGNYVVQYVLDLGMPWVMIEVISRLEGHVSYLAMQKFSSNVVEKLLKLAPDDHRSRIVREVTASPRLGHLLQDPYANYVVQSALTVSKENTNVPLASENETMIGPVATADHTHGNLHQALVEAIKPHLPALRSSPYGKRILSRTNIKK